jgi:hypothetical protein
MISPDIDREDQHMSSRERTPDEPSTENTSAVAEPPADGAEATRPSFAERVGKRSPVTGPDPFGIARDNLAAVRLFESKRDRQMAIKFGEGRPEDKPSQAVIDRLKEAGYHWNPSDRIWAHPVGGDAARSTRIEAERLYQDVRQMIRQEKGIESAPEVPF